MSIICCTSTLAVGVNLPCYLVVLKGTQGYGDAGLQEYSSLEVMQMLGRAGRPQFETEACAVILCLNDKIARYQKMVAGEEVLESSLHLNLIEHLNAEISIGTISNIATAKYWLTSTFLSIRLRANPKHYGLDHDTQDETPDDALLKWCEDGLQELLEADLIKDNGSLRCTDHGDAMARYCIKLATMKTFLAVSAKAKVSEILNALSQAIEFRDYRLKANEKGLFKDLNEANEIRYPFKVDIALTQHKVSLLIQARLGSVPLAKDSKTKFSGSQIRQLSLDTSGVLNHGKRLIRCMVDTYVHRNDSISVKNALALARSLAAGGWDDTVMCLKQLPGIGDVAMRKLASAHIRTIEELVHTEPHRLQTMLSKNPPYGHDLVKKASEFPRLHISVQQNGKRQVSEGAEVKLSCSMGFVNNIASKKFNNRQYSIIFLCETSYGNLVDFRRFSPSRLKDHDPVLLTALVTQPVSRISCHIMCDDLAGTHQYAELQINCPTSWFPPQTVRPSAVFEGPQIISSRDALPKGIEQFENGGVDDSDLLAAAVLPQTLVTESIDNIDDLVTEIESSKRIQKGRKRSISNTDRPQKERKKLPNGNWKCQHTCEEDGKDCKHACCLNGVKSKKAPAKKQKKNSQSEDEPSVSRSRKNSKKSAKPQPRQGSSDGMFDKRQRDCDPNGDESMHKLFDGRDTYFKKANRQPIRTEVEQGFAIVGDFTQQSVSDVFNSGEYDWQAIDNFAASWDGDRADGNAQNQGQTPMLRSHNDGRTPHQIDSEVLAGRDGNHQAHPQKPYSPNAEMFLVDQGFVLNDAGPRANFAMSNDSVDTSCTGSNGSIHRGLPSTDTSISNLTGRECAPHNGRRTETITAFESEEARRERWFVEDQKARWAVYNHDFLNYENFGRAITIVDDSD